MNTFKENLYTICADVAAEFPGWCFISGEFKNKTLKHTDLEIDLGFSFDRSHTSIQPCVIISNKKFNKLVSYIFGKNRAMRTSSVSMQTVAHLLKFTPENMRTDYSIVEDKKAWIPYLKKDILDETVDIADAYSTLTATLKDGIDFIQNHYDLSSEHALLSALPPKYTTRHENMRYRELEMGKGVILCIVRLLLGDFDFVVRYRSDNFKTIYPKRIAELDKIISVLPELKKRYAETGAVI